MKTAFVILAALLVPTASASAFQVHWGSCARSIHDSSGSGLCIDASSVPQPGRLLPLGPYFFVDPSGRVGIGSMSPAAALDLNFAGTDGLRVNSTNGSAPSVKLFQAGVEKATFHASGTDSFLGTTDASNLWLMTNGVSRLVLNQNGDFAIGPGVGPGQITRFEIYEPQVRQVLRITAPAGSDLISLGGDGRVRVDAPGVGYGRFVIADNGNVGIGLGHPNPSNPLTIAQGRGTGLADGWSTYSSRRFKENVQPIERPLDKVLALRGVTFDWKATGEHDLGFIAEEVAQVLPEVVEMEDDGEDARSLDYARLTAVLVEAVKEQEQRIRQLEETVAALAERPER